MIGSIVRSVAAVVLGLIAAMFFIVAIEGVSSVLHPFPPGVDPTDYEACKAHVARYPGWVLMLAVAGWGLATLVSSWLATRLGSGRHRAHGIVAGSILLVAAVVNMLMLPYPIWFWVANLLVFPVSFIAGSKLGQERVFTGPSAAV